MAAMHICIPVTVVEIIYDFSSKHGRECVGVWVCGCSITVCNGIVCVCMCVCVCGLCVCKRLVY